MEHMMGSAMGDSESDGEYEDEHYTAAEDAIAGYTNPASLSADQRLQLATIHVGLSIAHSLGILAKVEQDKAERREEMHDNMQAKGGTGGAAGDFNSMLRNYRG